MTRILPALLLLFVHQTTAQVVDFQQSHLPIVLINTGGQVIPADQKITAGMSLIDNGPGQLNHPTDPPNAYNGLIGIELRGSSSLQYDKRNFGIETRDLSGDDLAVSLLGMPEESDWALISPLNDKTLVRDMLAYWFAARAMDWAPRTRFVEVMLDGDYIGVYLLLETIKRDNDRVDIAKIKDSDLAGDSLTGGYILAMDKLDNGVGGDWKSAFPPYPGAWQETWFQVVYPKDDDIQPAQRAYIEDYLTEFEAQLNQWQPNTSLVYENWIDVDSWVDYLLVNEVTKNVDGYRLSAYFYKDRDDNDPRLRMGPVWDFNIAFGIGDYCEGQFYDGWMKDFNSFCGGDAWVIHFWWEKLLRDAAFQQRVKTRWQQLRSGAWSDAAVAGCLDSVTTLLNGAAARNFQRWPVLGQYVWPNAYIGQTWTEELNYLDSWLTNRIAWIDGNIMSIGPAVATQEPAGPQLFRPYPNPLTGTLLTIVPALPEGHFTLYDAAGRPVGLDIPLAANSTLVLPDKLAAGLYFYQIRQGNALVGAGKLTLR